MKITLLFFSMIVLRCCWGPTEYQIMQQQQNDDSIVKTLKGTYTINTLNLKNVEKFNLEITFDDEKNKVSGYAGCNNFFGNYTLKSSSIKFSPLASSHMMCIEEKNAIESELLKAFSKGNTLFFTKNGFSLFDNKKALFYASKITKSERSGIESFEYMALSRGSFKHIAVDENLIFVSNKKGAKPIQKNSTDLWKRLILICEKIDLSKISEFEAPSNYFQFDGAPLARLKIVLDGKTYESAPFDHGNPPKEIVQLVKEILSSAENIE